MFKTHFIPMDLQGVRPRAINGEAEKRAVDLIFQIRPFTRELASELGDHVRNHLFRLDDGGTRSEVKSLDLNLVGLQPQRIDFGPKDASGPLLTIAIAKVTDVKVKRDTETDGFILKFKASFEYPTAGELASLVAGLQRQHFVSLSKAEQSLIDAMEGEKRDDKNAADARAQERKSQRGKVRDGKAAAAGDTATH